MSTQNLHKFPKLHNAMWPGLVGRAGKVRARSLLSIWRRCWI